MFQQVDIEDSYDNSHAGARVRICGVTEVWSIGQQVIPSHCLLFVQKGHSVMASVTDFMPYFYVPAPRGFRSEDIDSFVNELNVRLGDTFWLTYRVSPSRLSRR